MEVGLVRVDRLSIGDDAAELLELLGEGGDQALAVGLLVVNRGDLLDAGRREQVLSGKGTLDGVRGARAEVGGVGPYRRGGVFRTLGQRRVGVGGGDLDDLGAGQHRLGALGDAGVQVAHDAGDIWLTGKCGGGVLAHVGHALVVLGFDLESPAGDGAGGVGLAHGELHGVLDTQAQSRQVAGQRCHDADHCSLSTAGRAAGAAVSGATR